MEEWYWDEGSAREQKGGGRSRKVIFTLHFFFVRDQAYPQVLETRL